MPFLGRLPQPSPLPESHGSLADTPVGWRRRVTDVADPARDELEREGVLPGVVVVVTSRTPLGGPVDVEIGRARLALSAGVASLVRTEPLGDVVGPVPSTLGGDPS